MKNNLFIAVALACFMLATTPVSGQNNIADSLMTSSTFKGLKFRNIGPAFMSGRIADVAIHPVNNNIIYVAVGSGGVWKTTNAGTTWDPIFDKEKSYSIGCITVDPHNPHRVWVGTGENVGGRHVGYGDGIYLSDDNGMTWKNMGLKETQHISKIIVHPEHSNILWVAAQGPLWNKGEQRGLYKTTDGGKTWKKTLGDAEWTGVTDIAIDPRNPDRLYAATWQRHRNVAAYMGGGPGSGIHRSTDGGETWQELENGLPKSNMGKIGLAISPQNPDVIYAAIELDRRSGGVYKSENRGASWKKMSDAVSGATGPHYYQELYASPHEFDKIYLVDVRVQESSDGGKTFKRMNEKYKHSDNHVIAFRKNDPDYMLVGTDGGLYETFDGTETWRYMANLPVTQYYKLALDDAKPFYNIYGGTQDNSTQGGPSQTDNRHGIRNSDWQIVLGGDGHQPATEPGNPDIVYAQSQEGELHRVDLTTGEAVYIKPQPRAGENYERNNWDSPILVSPHAATRLYFGSQRVWRSDNRGDSWEPISGDLTKNQERLELPIMGKKWGWDATWDFEAMSNYNTITSLAESPVQEGLIYAGTDDGIIQVTEDGGENWRKIEVGNIQGVPPTAFVNDIKADLYDVNTVYVVLDNHKFGDLMPYLVKSTDKGKSWSSMRGDLPDRTTLWRLVQDHEKKDLFFLATEFGIYFTIDGGKQWIKFESGVPTISFRDLAIQKQEDDLVAASFGRGFFILDDYSPLRGISPESLKAESLLFEPAPALWYTPRRMIGWSEKGSQGAQLYTAPNPPFGAVFTYYLKEGLKTKKEEREKRDKKLAKENKDIPFPGWEELEAERRQQKPEIVLTVRNDRGEVVNRVNGPVKKGIHRVDWDLRYPSAQAIDPDQVDPEKDDPRGLMVPPGMYTVDLSKIEDGKTTFLSEAVPFEVKPLYEGTLEGSTLAEADAYRKEMRELQKSVSALTKALSNADKRVQAMQEAIDRTPGITNRIDSMLYILQRELDTLDIKVNGNRAKREIGEKNDPTLRHYYRVAMSGASNLIYGPTPMHRENLQMAKAELKTLKTELEEIRQEKLPVLENLLKQAGAPWIEGQELPE